jgi:sorting nexin-4
LQDAVTTAHETSDAFSDETLREQAVFQYAKEAEMKEMLGNLADGEIEFYKSVCPVNPFCHRPPVLKWE